MVYLDNNATTPLDPAVIEKMTSFSKEYFGNPSSLYPIGRAVKDLITQSREAIAQALGAMRTEIVFTGSGTEADNFAVRGVLSATMPEKNQFITSAIEHPAIMEPARYLANKGVEVVYIPVDEYGEIDLSALQDAVSDRTALISVMHANNELGTIQSLEDVVRIAHQRGILVHTDAIQTFGKIDVNVKKLDVDLLSISAHKIYGPKGIGALYIRKGTPIRPLIYGGHQERELRAGTENTIGIIGFGEAARQTMEKREKDSKTIGRLAERLKRGIEEQIPNVKFNGHETKRIKGTLNFAFSGLEAEAILLALATKEIYVSTGSACSLSAIGLGPEQARGALRMSLGRFNTEEDVDKVLLELPEIVSRLRQISAIEV